MPFVRRDPVRKDVPRSTFSPEDVPLGSLSRIAVQRPTGNNPKLLVSAQLGDRGAAVSAKAAGIAGVLSRVYELLDLVLPFCPADRPKWIRQTGIMDRSRGLLAGMAVAIQEPDGLPRHLIGN